MSGAARPGPARPGRETAADRRGIGQSRSTSGGERRDGAMLEAALAYAGRGWRVLPLQWPVGADCSCPPTSLTRDKETGRCRSPGKHPTTRHGVHDAATDADALRRWWSRWPDANSGIETGAETGIVVLDVDPRHGGDDTLRALERVLGPLPETPTVDTGGGGQHYYFAAPAGAPHLAATLGAGVDVKHDGGYVVAPPSVHASGARYEWCAERAPDEIALAELPEQWLAALRRPKREDASADAMPDCDVPVEVREERARRYVARMPAAISGQGGHRALWAAAVVVVRGMMLPPDRAMAVLRDYSARCEPPWSDRELAHKIRDARRGRVPWGYLVLAQRGSDAGSPPRDDVPPPGAGDDRGDGDHHHAWEPFVPLEHARELPEMPLHVLPPWLREMVAATARAYQVPPELPGMYALALVCGAIAGKYVVQVRPGWRMPPTLYALVALPPSERKTPVIRDLAEPLRAWERAKAEEIAKEREAAVTRVKQAQAREAAALRAITRPPKGANSDALSAAHAKAARVLAEAEAAVPPEARLIVEYATPEALAERMANNGDRQVILSDEGAGVLAMTGRYARWGGADLDLLLRGFDGLPYTPARITRQVRPLDAATLTIALAAQPAAVAALLREAPEIRERGLLSRFLVLLPRPRVGTREVRAAAVPDAARLEYERRMRALLDVPDERDERGRLRLRELRMSPAADDVIARLESELEPAMGTAARYDRIAAWAGKLAGQAGRIAAVLHAAEHAGATLPATIEAATAERAVLIVRACLPHAEALEDLLAAPPELTDARRLAGWLQQHGQPVVTEREMLRGLRGLDAAGRDAALRLLARHGHVRPLEHPSKPGRPRERWEVHPTWLASQCEGVAHHRDNTDNTPAAGEPSPDIVRIVPPPADSAPIRGAL